MQRYPFLRFATTVLRVVGWIVLVAGVIGFIAFGISFLAWLFLLATRELFYLLIQVEENTRNTAERITITGKSSQD
jgi:hypothetical protein